MASDKEPVVIPVAREEASVARKLVDKGAVRVRKVVRESVEFIDEPLLHDEIDIEHVVVNRVVDAPEPPREEGHVLIIPVYEEVLTVQRKWVLRAVQAARQRGWEVGAQGGSAVAAAGGAITAPRGSGAARGRGARRTTPAARFNVGSTARRFEDVENSHRPDGQHGRGAEPSE